MTGNQLTGTQHYRQTLSSGRYDSGRESADGHDTGEVTWDIPGLKIEPKFLYLLGRF